MGKVRKLPPIALIPAAATLLLIAAAWLAPASSAHATPSTNETPTPTTTPEPCAPLTAFDAAEFSDPTNIDNEWLPIVPWRKLVLKGVTDGRHHRVVLIATDLTKVVNGVRTRVVWLRDYRSGRLKDAELAFFAQDDAGNVWRLGQYAEDYENGQFVGASNTWIAGLAEAEAGIRMAADPDAGGTGYLSASAPDIDLLECAKVIAKNEGTEFCVPLRCFDAVLVTEERRPLDEGNEHKINHHAAEVGVVQIAAANDPAGEPLALIRDVELSTSEKLWARRKAFALEARAYEVSEVYGETAPMEGLVNPPAETPTPTPVPTSEPAEPTPGPSEPTPEPTEPGPEATEAPSPVAAVVPTPTPLVAPLRTIPAVSALTSFEAPRRPSRSAFLPGILPSILPSTGGLPGDKLGSASGLVMIGAALTLVASYCSFYLRPKGARAQRATTLQPNRPPLGPSSFVSARREALERQERARFKRNIHRTDQWKEQSSHD